LKLVPFEPPCHFQSIGATATLPLPPSAALSRKPHRHIPALPERVLDAPELLDDYYLNLLDW
jgi:hypothetical protein